MMPFLYFPEDKSEYIPAIITLVVFFIAAGITMYIIYKKSKKDEKKFKQEYHHELNESRDK
ncbi:MULTISPECIES: hypothetical protein [Virgibacillus]|uniref:Sporulation protein n=1 Tax=Virgibacillus pantothenticus TaxID=1473 RepID=A0A0L0QU69_VIRPA|nr:MULTISPECIES: hypothetical protein [Virgibacillus]API90933.1 hypothetical protein BKP57_03120 [Virgibacillus sp. 6R]KNE22106.1 hypothetical protein AFK71_04745 [Virgibacillus pantothenticus]MBS7428908.1 hypothetical protein [Virgibacillus sp. 19R1-5]MBU8566660.1 hypothetical protein [Virgibacillus pantothenticus]MBU8600243.1 hypothetical protein [Virgibacillus pantothenticus]